MTAKLAEVRRLLDRYLVEVVEEFALCPWARPARTGGELAVDVLWGQPALEDWVESAKSIEMNHKYVEFPQGDHGNVINDGMPQIFEFFKANTRK